MISKYAPPLEKVIEYAAMKSNPGIQFGYGNQLELHNYLRIGKSKEQGNAIIEEERKEFIQYPLIWFVPPTSTKMAKVVQLPNLFSFKNAVIIFALNNPNSEWLNPQREEESFSKLYPIADKFLDYLKKNRFVTFENSQKPEYGFGKEPNISHSDKNKTIDVWDAIVIEANLKFDINCLKIEQHEKKCE